MAKLLTLTAGAAPAFLKGNLLTRYADQASDLSVSSGVSLRHRLYDMDPAGQWSGETASDASDETITGGLWLPGLQSSQSVDFMAVLGHNLASFDFYLSNDNGGTYVAGASPYSTAAETNNYTRRSLAAAVSADKFKIIAHTTQTANAYKLIGTIILAEAQFQPTLGMSLFKRHPLRVKDRSAKMADNSTRRSYVYRSDASYGFHDFTVGLAGLSDADADALEAILLGVAPFLFMPEPGDRPREIYLGQVMPGTYTRDYVNRSRSGGWAISFDFEESGGA